MHTCGLILVKNARDNLKNNHGLVSPRTSYELIRSDIYGDPHDRGSFLGLGRTGVSRPRFSTPDKFLFSWDFGTV
jgi:hypothetical protein